MAHGLSKSKLMSFRQCPRKLWLEKHRPELAAEIPGQEAVFALGHEVGDIARRLYDTGGGVLIDYDDGLKVAMQRTREVLAERSSAPVFEATFERNGLLVRKPSGTNWSRSRSTSAVRPVSTTTNSTATASPSPRAGCIVTGQPRALNA